MSMNTAEAAKYLLGEDAKKSTLEQMRHRRTGPAFFKVGQQVRYRQSELDRYIEAQTVRNDQPLPPTGKDAR